MKVDENDMKGNKNNTRWIRCDKGNKAKMIEMKIAQVKTTKRKWHSKLKKWHNKIKVTQKIATKQKWLRSQLCKRCDKKQKMTQKTQ